MKKNIIEKSGVLALFILSLLITSCGGSSGGGDEEIDFELKDLVGNVWYSNPFLSDDYDNDDAIIAYRFEGDGILKRQQYSGRREKVVGAWSLKDDVLEITDNSVSGGVTQKWFVQSGSTTDYLKLNSNGGGREFRTSIPGLEDVTADAYWVNDLRLVDGNYEADYRVDYEVFGNDLSDVVAMFSDSQEEELFAISDYKEEKVFVLTDEGLARYADDFSGAQSIRFYLESKGNDKFKLDEDLYNKNIAVLNSTRGYDQDTHHVAWKAIDESGIYYTIEILSSISNARTPLFRSYPQPASPEEEKQLEISNKIDAPIPLSNDMVIGENYFIRISGIRYEEGIDPINSINRSYNIQAKTVFTYKITW